MGDFCMVHKKSFNPETLWKAIWDDKEENVMFEAEQEQHLLAFASTLLLLA